MVSISEPQSHWQLKELLAVLDPLKVDNLSNSKVLDITHNSNQVTPGTLFIAIPGFKADGHQYIKEAIKKGAHAIVGEKERETDLSVPYIQVNDSRKAIAHLAAKFYNYPGDKVKLIGVTGSTGKTTTTKLITNILKQVTPNTGLIGTLHTEIKNNTYPQPKSCTTPDALELNRRLYAMYQQGVEYVSMEVSSHALKLDRVTGLDFDLGLFTNLSYDHLNFHKGLTDYFNSKKKLFTNLKLPSAAILNQDDEHSRKISFELSVPHFFYGFGSQADLKAEKIDFSPRGISFLITLKKPLTTLNGKNIAPTSFPVSLPLLGKHNIHNALGAALTGLLLDIEPEKIKEGLESFSGVPRRLELIYDDEFTIIDDFAHNPASLKANFKTLQQLDYNKLVIVHFLKGKRGQQANKRNAQLIATWRKELNLTDLITTRAEGEVKPKNEVLPAEEETFSKVIKDTELNFTSYKTLKPALKDGLNRINPGDLLLLLGGPGLKNARNIIKKILD